MKFGVKRNHLFLLIFLFSSVVIARQSSCFQFFKANTEFLRIVPADEITKNLIGFNTKSAIVVDTGINFNKPDIEKAISFISQLHEGDRESQITIEITNASEYQSRVKPIGVIQNLAHSEVRSAGRLDARVKIPDPNPKEDQFLSILRPRLTEVEVNSGLSNSFQSSLADFIKNTMQSFLEARGEGFKFKMGNLMLRITSDSIGHKVTKESFGNYKTGLHTHKIDDPNSLEFTMSLSGSGTVVKINNELFEVPTGKALLFGGQAEHGSPSSSEIRLIIVGRIVLQPIT